MAHSKKDETWRLRKSPERRSKPHSEKQCVWGIGPEMHWGASSAIEMVRMAARAQKKVKVKVCILNECVEENVRCLINEWSYETRASRTVDDLEWYEWKGDLYPLSINDDPDAIPNLKLNREWILITHKKHTYTIKPSRNALLNKYLTRTRRSMLEYRTIDVLASHWYRGVG